MRDDGGRDIGCSGRDHRTTQDYGIDALILVTGAGGEAFEIVVRESPIVDCLLDANKRTAAQDLTGQPSHPEEVGLTLRLLGSLLLADTIAHYEHQGA
ncbi:hypothetical protein [Leucobacter sp. L43]|uniref:hypothetical protein n=1 Tax=Leucobacter sp. L43 TaxID=2798040 RepID=UPI001904981C|nr:hypothetical protein [Leucobacter sp. L43]